MGGRCCQCAEPDSLPAGYSVCMTCWQLTLAITSGLGTLLALLGLVLLFSGARNRYIQARGQLRRALELVDEENAERRVEGANSAAILEKYIRLHADNGLPRPAGYGHSYQPGYESVNVMRALGNGAWRDLLIASLGLLLSGVASVLSFLFPVL